MPAAIEIMSRTSNVPDKKYLEVFSRTGIAPNQAGIIAEICLATAVSWPSSKAMSITNQKRHMTKADLSDDVARAAVSKMNT